MKKHEKKAMKNIAQMVNKNTVSIVLPTLLYVLNYLQIQLCIHIN